MLEKSVARPPRETTDTQPFSSTVAALNTRPSSFFRAVPPLAMIAVIGLTLLAWGRGAQSNSPAAGRDAPGAASPMLTSLDSSLTGAQAQQVTPAAPTPLSQTAARQIVNSVSHGQIGDVHVVRTDARQSQALIAIHDEREKGTTHLFVMEPRGGRYRVVARTPLDAHGFKGASWTAESRDINGDGYDEVLCTGTNAKGHASDYRLVLYVPRTRRAYSMRVESGWGRKGRQRATFSSNVWTTDAAPYRAALQQRARAAVATF
jgi:hypothetical protein